MPFDLDAYLARIEYAGSRTPTLDTLRVIQRRHATVFPFENISSLMGWPIDLDMESLQHKMVRNGRGGYCFEQNLLFSHALEALGFTVIGLSARVLSSQASATTRPRSHMLLLVPMDDQSYIADVGFGRMTLTAPIRLEHNTVQTTPHERHKLVQVGDEYIMHAQVRDEWRPMYRFDLRPTLLPDYEMANWYVATHPNSQFSKTLIAARPTANGRYTLRNNEFAVHHLDGKTERSLLTTAEKLRAVLEDVFLIRLPNHPQLGAKLEKLATSRPEATSAAS